MNHGLQRTPRAAATARKSMATTANVLLIAGTVVAAGGVTWALLSRKKSEPDSAATLHLTLTPGGVRFGGRL